MAMNPENRVIDTATALAIATLGRRLGRKLEFRFPYIHQRRICRPPLFTFSAS